MILPEPAATLARTWGFTPTERLSDGHCSHLWANEASVLKVPFRGEELDSGFRAALAFQRIDGPVVRECDPTTGIALLERLKPGSPLGDSKLDEGARLDVFVRLVRRIRGVFSEPWDRPMPLGAYVRRTLRTERLLATAEADGPLHGDLHPFNILRHGNRWRPIDPKGVWGDPHYEAAAWLRNALPSDPNRVGPLTEWRIVELASRLGLDPGRIAAWALEDALDGDGIATPSLHTAYIEALRELVQCTGF